MRCNKCEENIHSTFDGFIIKNKIICWMCFYNKFFSKNKYLHFQDNVQKIK